MSRFCDFSFHFSWGFFSNFYQNYFPIDTMIIIIVWEAPPTWLFMLLKCYIHLMFVLRIPVSLFALFSFYFKEYFENILFTWEWLFNSLICFVFIALFSWLFICHFLQICVACLARHSTKVPVTHCEHCVGYLQISC